MQSLPESAAKRYGKVEEFKFHKGGDIDLKVVDRETLIGTLRKCHQTLWGGGRLSPPAAFSELCKLISVKIRDETGDLRPGDPYQFQIKTHEPSHRLADRIRILYNAEREQSPDVFTSDIGIDDPTLRTVVSHLEAINLSETEIDVKGVAFERFMGGFFKGDFGQYFTPREVIEFIIEMMPPNRTDVVLDPACGSAGFLLHALKHVRKLAGEFHTEGSRAHDRYWEDFAAKNLYGIEINDEIARVAKMNMVINGDGHTNIVCTDGLARLDRIRQQTDHGGFGRERFSLVLTNPPFGGQVALVDRPYVGDYALGRVTDAKGVEKLRKSQKTEILYIERIWEFLRAGGRAAVILPDGILTNASLQYVRDFIVERFKLLAVVSLPQTAFAHYGTTVKASVLFLQKRSPNEDPDENEGVFMAAPELIGYDATGRTTGNELKLIVERYHDFQKDKRPFFS